MFKKVKDEKLQTQVLNLEEVREIGEEEKYNKHKKLPKRFVIVAVILILLGILYLPGRSFVSKLQAEEKIIPTNKNSITCTIDKGKDKSGYEINSTTIFNFVKNNLVGYNLVSTTKLSKQEDKENFKKYFEDLSKKYRELEKIDGFKGKVTLTDNKIIQNMTVNLEDLNKSNSIILYKLNDTKEEIIKSFEKKEAKCE